MQETVKGTVEKNCKKKMAKNTSLKGQKDW